MGALVEDLRWAVDALLAGGAAGGVVVVGVGNRDRGDDGVGPAVAEELRSRGIEALDVGDAPERYLGPIVESGAQVVVFVDAVDFGGAAGQVVLLAQQEVAQQSCVTHRSALGLVMRYLRQEAGQRSLLVGVQPGSLGYGEGLTPPVRQAVGGVAAALAAALQRGRETHVTVVQR